MTNWIAADTGTAATLIRRFGCASVRVDQNSDLSNPLLALLQAPVAVALMPAQSDSFALVATIRRSQPLRQQSQVDPLQPHREPRQVATGFLGLVDELVWDDEEEKTSKRKWWQKLLD